MASGIIVCSLLLYGYTRRALCDCPPALNLGLLYEVVLAFGIGVVNQWTPNTTGTATSGSDSAPKAVIWCTCSTAIGSTRHSTGSFGTGG
ncbi:MAG: hypothetical protein HY700_11010 [Gemmatimonadetes bacterium]|nr:hypothetical protein [Gemmatimonadota bacterium]